MWPTLSAMRCSLGPTLGMGGAEEAVMPGSGRRRITVFKPSNARPTTAFYGAQHVLFRYLQDRFDMEFTYVVDDRSVSFDGIRMTYVEKSVLGTLLTGAYKLFISDQIKYPLYRHVGFSDCDVVIAEGILYSLLHYVRHDAAKVILNDSLSRDPGFSKRRVQYLNTSFSAAHSVVVTEKVRSVYAHYGITIPVTVIGHPVNTADIGFRGRHAAPRRLLSVGRLVREKGYEVIIDAVAQLAGAYPDVTLDIFGAGPLDHALARRIGALGMQSRIKLLGHVRREELLQRLADYDLFVSHPLTTNHSAEAFLMANVEAMAAGLPVITSDCGAVPTVVEDKAIVIPEGDARGLQSALERFVGGREDVAAQSVAGRLFVEQRYALPAIAERWREVIEKVASRDRR
jgi:glycosyltransferase involved in cell wall biosynthesis